MKLPIKQKYLDEIKSGKKQFEYRDSHITYVSEETGEELLVEVIDVERVIKEYLFIGVDAKDLFDDDILIRYHIKIPTPISKCANCEVNIQEFNGGDYCPKCHRVWWDA